MAGSFSPALLRSRGDLCGVRSTPLQRSTNIASHPLCRNDVETDPASTSDAEGSSWGLLFVWLASAATPRAFHLAWRPCKFSRFPDRPLASAKTRTIGFAPVVRYPRDIHARAHWLCAGSTSCSSRAPPFHGFPLPASSWNPHSPCSGRPADVAPEPNQARAGLPYMSVSQIEAHVPRCEPGTPLCHTPQFPCVDAFGACFRRPPTESTLLPTGDPRAPSL